MWVMTPKGFISVVAWHEGGVIVRGRVRKDLQALRPYFEGAGPIQVTPGRDYRYKFRCETEAFAQGMAELARETATYSNFKSAVGKRDRKREHVYHQIWGVLSRLQPGGPYGYGTKSGYPPVPKSEEKTVEQARASRSRRREATLFDAGAPRSSRLRRGAPEAVEECHFCGRTIEGDEIEYAGRYAYCSDIEACVGASRSR